MKKLKKIEMLIILSTIYIVLSFIISLLITFCVATLIDKQTIQIIVCLLVLFVSFPLFGLFGNLIYKIIRKHIFIEQPYICFKCSKNSVLESIKQNSIQINNNCFCTSKKQKYLKTITIHEISDSINYDDIHKKIITARKEIKKRFSLPKDPSPVDYHWMIDINVIIVDRISDEELKMLFLKINDQYYEVGKYFAVFATNNNQLYCSIFSGKTQNLVAFYRYKRCQRMLLNAFDI